MNEKILSYIYHGLENSKQAVFFLNKRECTSLYANKRALSIFGNSEGTIDVYEIFKSKETSPFLRSTISTDLLKKGVSMVYDVPLTTNLCDSIFADVQIAYADLEKEVLVLELFFKTDNRMEAAISQVNQSTRAEGILNFDARLTLVHGNNLFYDVFEMDEEIRQKHYHNEFINGLQPDVREELLAQIHDKLNQHPTFFSKIKIITSKGIEKWYSLELQRRTLDDSCVDKLMVYLVNIESQVEIEEQLDDINGYFSILQSMWGGKLYRFDTKNRILYRTSEYAQSYNLPVVGEHYPDIPHLKNVIHPEDLQRYLDFIEEVVAGKEGSLASRVKISGGEYEYHNMTFKALRDQEGSIKEMIGFAENIHAIRETEDKLDSVNQYFTALQKLSDDMLYRVDLETKTLYRTTEQAEIFGIKPIMPNYPYSVFESGLIHPDDEKNYLKYGNDVLVGIGGETEVRMKSNTGEYEFRRLTCFPVYGEHGTVKEMFGKIVNIQMVRELEEQANYDALTKLLNKRAMLEFTTRILLEATKADRHALFFMDLDDFKYVNDNLGHAFGDFLLGELGKRLREGVRQQDLVGRVGGDEFVLFLRDVPSIDVVLGKAKMILSTISEDFTDGITRHNMHGSLGIAVFPDHGESYEELYHHADLALYSSKHKGKNQVTIYSEELKKQ